MIGFHSMAIEAPIPPVVSNLTAVHRADGDLQIHYDLAAEDPCDITLEHSLDNGANWISIPSHDINVSGDLGAGVEPGAGRQIAWLFAATIDFAGASERSIRLRLRADDGNLTVLLPGNVPLVLRKVPAGTFTMGSPTVEPGRRPDEGAAPQPVTISTTFYLGKYEVTQAQWLALMGFGGICPTDCTTGTSDLDSPNLCNPSFHWGTCDRPVEGYHDNSIFAPIFQTVDWFGASQFINVLNSLGQGSYMLPTEAQWEFACRAGAGTAYHNGLDADAASRDKNLALVGWFAGNSDSLTHIAGLKTPNAFGLHDMHGNVLEWCLDGTRAYGTGAITDPVGPLNGSHRAVRGGSWKADALECRSAARLNVPATTNSGAIGFRVAGIGTPIIAEQERNATVYNSAVDSDSDLLPDGYETAFFSDLSHAADDDFDNDGITNADEFLIGTSPATWDSDGDGMDDGFERDHGLDFLNIRRNDAEFDNDNDGLSNLLEYIGNDGISPKSDLAPVDGVAEINVTGDTLDPTNPDTDDDGLSDGFEFIHFISGVLEANVADSDSNAITDDTEDPDRDGLDNAAEETHGTDPFSFDTDGDGMDDAFEVHHQLDPLNISGDDTTLDSDSDGLTAIQEYLGIDGVPPLKDDDPADGVAELTASLDALDPRNPDSDGDGLGDGFEFAHHSLGVLDPAIPDSATADPDADGLGNNAEETAGTDPFDPDSDADTIPDGYEVRHGLNPLADGDAVGDPDHDGVNNLTEFLSGANARNWDTDADGMGDHFEIEHGFDPGLADGHLDSDNDGLSNLLEYRGNDGVGPLQDTNSDGVAEAGLAADTLDPTQPDSDADLLGDLFEFTYLRMGLIEAWLPSDPTADPDRDGLSHAMEENAGTNPFHWDTDGDQIDDNFETTNGLDPTVNDAAADRDNDNLNNLSEYRGADAQPPLLDDLTGRSIAKPNRRDAGDATRPDRFDTDGDGMDDGYELRSGLNPQLNDSTSDPDQDDLTNLDEYVGADLQPPLIGDGTATMTAATNAADTNDATAPRNWDSDDDTIDDGFEVAFGLNPLHDDASNDLDNDALTNITEYRGADAFPPKSDDGSGSRTAKATAGDTADATRPDHWDSDGDGIDDGYEVVHGLDALNGGGDDSVRDPDGDTITNIQEYLGKDGKAPLSDPDMDNIAEPNPLGDAGDATDPKSGDSDGDGIPDAFERATEGLNGSVAADALLDFDNDGLNNLEEFRNGTSLFDWDTDDDGIDDGYEVGRILDPVNLFGDDSTSDPDKDGVVNVAEYLGDDGLAPLVDGDTPGIAIPNPAGDGGDALNPGAADTDGDGIPDNVELATPGLAANNPLDANLDLDNDGVSNLQEFQSGTQLLHFDSDGDQIADGYERIHGLDPLVDDAMQDPDGDNVDNLTEFLGENGLAPLVDINADGVAEQNAAELMDDALDPFSADSDGDGFGDRFELDAPELNAKDPADADADLDEDGISNFAEFLGADNVSDTGDETDFRRFDTDGDTLGDGFEIASELNPLSIDSDDDGVADAAEIDSGSDPRWPFDPLKFQMLSLPGPADTATIAPLERFDLENYTVALWVFPVEAGVLLEKGDNIRLSVTDNGALRVAYTEIGGDPVALETMDQIAFEHWSHIAFSLDPAVAQAAFYLDGAAVASTTVIGEVAIDEVPVIDEGAAIVIGADFTGFIDDLQFWNLALPPETILSLLSARPAANAVDLLAFYSFNDGQWPVSAPPYQVPKGAADLTAPEIHESAVTILDNTAFVAGATPQESSSIDSGAFGDDGTGDNFVLSLTDGVIAVRNGGSGTVLFSRRLTELHTLIITGSSDSDTLIIDFSGGNPLPPGGMVFDALSGPGRIDSLLLSGGTAAEIVHIFANANDGSIRVDGRLISYTGLEPITDTVMSGFRLFQFGAAADEIRLTNDGVPDNGRSRISSHGSSETTDFIEPTDSITINGGAGDDHVVLGTTSLESTVPLLIDGGDGVNTLTFHTFGATVFHNPTTGSITGDFGSITYVNFDSVNAIGSSVHTIPTLSQWGIILLGILLVCIGIRSMPRHLTRQ